MATSGSWVVCMPNKRLLPALADRDDQVVLGERWPVHAWSSPLIADVNHPFFFDHPLDHVPGILLVTGLLDLVTGGWSKTTRTGNLQLGLSFPRFCELDQPTVCVACPVRGDAWAVQATQSGQPVCLGSVHHHSGYDHRGDPPPAYPDQGNPQPVDQAAVHRLRGENVLLGAMDQPDGGPLRIQVRSSSAGDHFFTRRAPDHRDPVELIEATRQAAVVLWSRAYHWPLDARLTFNGLTADVPVALARDVSLELRWWPRPARDRKARSVFELVADRTVPRLVGRIVIDSQAWLEQDWQRLRARKG